MGKVLVFDHPLMQHKISIIRDKNTKDKQFRETVEEIAMLMVYEATRDLPLKEVEIETPICKAKVNTLADREIVIVPVLRAGLGMVSGMHNMIPTARVGHIGMYRDPETYEPVPYYCKLPANLEDAIVIVLDPMLATGGSMNAAIEYLKKEGAKDIRVMCLIASERGIDAVTKAHPDVDIYAAAFDKELNDHCYIVPGLGDAGDRLYGTK